MNLGLGLSILKGNKSLEGGSAPSLPLDLVPGAYLAWGTRALSSAYVNENIFKLRRADNVTSDFKEEDIYNGNIMSWANGQAAAVCQLYDQTGNNRHSSNNATYTNCPLFITGAGNFYKFRGRPVTRTNGDTVRLNSLSIPIDDGFQIFTVGQSTILNDNVGPFSLSTLGDNTSFVTAYDYLSNSDRTVLRHVTAGTSAFAAVTDGVDNTTYRPKSKEIRVNVGGDTYYAFTNNRTSPVTGGIPNRGGVFNQAIWAEKRHTNADYFNGYVGEAIVYSGPAVSGDTMWENVSFHYGIDMNTETVDLYLEQAALDIGTVWNSGNVIDISESEARSFLSDDAVLQLNAAGITVITSGALEDPYGYMLNQIVAKGETAPSASVQNLQRDLFNGLFNSTMWSKFDFFKVYAHDGSEGFGLYNWINLDKHKATNSGVNWTTLEGFTGNNSGFLNTGFNASGSTKYQLNDAAFGGYTYKANTFSGNTNYEDWYVGSIVNRLGARSNSRTYMAIHSSSSNSAAFPSRKGVTFISRTSSANLFFWLNADTGTSQYATTASVSSGTMQEMRYTSSSIAISFIGAGLTQAEGDTLKTLMDTYITAIDAL